MANVIHLEPGISPPDEACMAVVRDVTGGFYVVSSEQDLNEVAPASPNPISEADRAATIERATAYADLHKLKTVYVVS